MQNVDENAEIARLFEETAELLRDQRANPFRVTAYLNAAQQIRSLTAPVREIFSQGGHDGLVALPAIGDSIARAIAEIILTGRWSFLEQLRGTSAPEALFAGIPGIGPSLAEAIHSHLHVETLEALERAAHDGRLETVPGIGPGKAATVRNALAARLPRLRTAAVAADRKEPPVSLLLDIDRQYRRDARADHLPRIAPLRFNPTGAAWLPILHQDADGWSFTALFSNTATAHRFGRTDDWVIVVFSQNHEHEGQRTIVTETGGALKGKRVVRGREAECRRHYETAV